MEALNNYITERIRIDNIKPEPGRPYIQIPGTLKWEFRPDDGKLTKNVKCKGWYVGYPHEPYYDLNSLVFWSDECEYMFVLVDSGDPKNPDEWPRYWEVLKHPNTKDPERIYDEMNNNLFYFEGKYHYIEKTQNVWCPKEIDQFITDWKENKIRFSNEPAV